MLGFVLGRLEAILIYTWLFRFGLLVNSFVDLVSMDSELWNWITKINRGCITILARGHIGIYELDKDCIRMKQRINIIKDGDLRIWFYNSYYIQDDDGLLCKFYASLSLLNLQFLLNSSTSKSKWWKPLKTLQSRVKSVQKSSKKSTN